VPRLGEAVAEAERVGSGRGEARTHLARLYRALLRPGDAEREIGLALAEEPGHEPARYERALLAAWALRARARAGCRLMLATGQEVAGPDADAEERARLREDAAALAGGVSAAERDCARGLALALAGSAADRGESARLLAQAWAGGGARGEAQEGLAAAQEGLAALAEAEGKWAEAAAALREGLSADRGLVPSRAGLVLALLRAGDTQKAEEALIEATTLHPQSAEIRLCRAAFHARESRRRREAGIDPEPHATRASEDAEAAAKADPTLAGEARAIAEAAR